MLAGLEAFVGMLGTSGLRSCAWNHLKKALCYTHPYGGTADKFRWFQSPESCWWDTLRPGVVSATQIWSSVSHPWTYLEPRGPSTQALTLLRGARFIACVQKSPFLGKCRRGSKHFWSCHTCHGYGPTPAYTLNKAWTTLVRMVGRSTKSADFNQLNPVDGTPLRQLWCQRYRSGWVCLVTGHKPILREPSPQARTLFWGIRFIA